MFLEAVYGEKFEKHRMYEKIFEENWYGNKIFFLSLDVNFPLPQCLGLTVRQKRPENTY